MAYVYRHTSKKQLKASVSKWLFRIVNKSTKSRYHKERGNPFHNPGYISEGLIPSGHEMFVEPLTALDSKILGSDKGVWLQKISDMDRDVTTQGSERGQKKFKSVLKCTGRQSSQIRTGVMLCLFHVLVSCVATEEGQVPFCGFDTQRAVNDSNRRTFSSPGMKLNTWDTIATASTAKEVEHFSTVLRRIRSLRVHVYVEVLQISHSQRGQATVVSSCKMPRK